MAKETTYTFKKGTHKSRPIVLDSFLPRHKVQSREFECVLTKSCVYIFRKQDGTLHPNQWDFSKLRGNSHKLFDNHENAYMGAWRWDPISVQFDLTSYFHVNGDRYIGPTRLQMLEREKYVLPSEVLSGQMFSRFPGQLVKSFDSLQHYKLMERVQVMATVVPGEKFRYGLFTDWDNMLFGVGFKARSTDMLWKIDWTSIMDANTLTRDILHWFGGDFAAPHKMQLIETKL